MRFEEKRALTMTLLLIVVSGAYFTVALGPVAAFPNRQAASTGVAVGATVVLAALSVLAHVALALTSRAQVSAGRDERDRLIALRSERWGSYVLAVGVFAGVVLAMSQIPPPRCPRGSRLDSDSSPRTR